MLKRVSIELWFVRSTKSIRNYELRITCKRLIEVCAEHKNKRHYVPRRKPACAKVSEEKRRTV